MDDLVIAAAVSPQPRQAVAGSVVSARVGSVEPASRQPSQAVTGASVVSASVEPASSSFGIAMDSLFGEPYSLFNLLSLDDYVDSALNLGYDDARDLVRLPEGEVDELVAALVHSQTGKGMLPAHASRLRRGLREGRIVLQQSQEHHSAYSHASHAGSAGDNIPRGLKSTNHRHIPFSPLCN